MNNSLQSPLYSIIRKGYEKRKEDKIFPYVVMEKDIIQEIRALVSGTLDAMVADGIIKVSSNINGLRMFAPANEEMIINNDNL